MATGWKVVILFFCLNKVRGSLTNIALRKPAWQSSYYDITRFPADNGVDGDTLSFIVTQVSNNHREAVWGVYLGREADDARVTIYFRNYYIHRNKGLRLYTSATNFTSNTDGDLCHTVAEQTPLVISVNCTGSWSFLKVYSDMVQNPNDMDSPVMDFAEVEVWACEVGKYGPSCSLSCDGRKCKGPNSRCNQWTGECVGGCQAGWEGVDCTRECQSGVSYARNCESSCGNRHCLNPSASCDVKTGSCGVDRCQPGWKGEDCAIGCIIGAEYGRNCESNCASRHCLNPSASCDVQTGSCGVDRCQAGWKGTDCVAGCESGSEYGTNCEGECGQRHCFDSSASCDVLIGSCGADRCQAGWNGTDCLQGCIKGAAYGRNCEGNCDSRHCLNPSASCDVQTGSCGIDRCQAGWKGTDCVAGCEPGSEYGANCEGECGQRHCSDSSASCDVLIGSCGAERCQTGWNGTDCSFRIFVSSPSDNIMSGVIGAVITLIITMITILVIFLIRRYRSNRSKIPDVGIVVKLRVMGNHGPTATDDTYVYHNDEIATDNTHHVYNNDYTVMKTEDMEPQYHEYTAIETRRELRLS